MFFSNFIRFDLEVGCISIIKNSFFINSKFFNEKSLYSYPSISHKIKEGDFFDLMNLKKDLTLYGLDLEIL